MPGFYSVTGNKPPKKKRGFYGVKNKDTKNTLEVDGVKLGTVTNNGLRAIETNTLDSYTPETDEELQAIEKYKEMQNAKTQRALEALGKFSPSNPRYKLENSLDIYAQGKGLDLTKKETDPESEKRTSALLEKPNFKPTIKTEYGDVELGAPTVNTRDLLKRVQYLPTEETDNTSAEQPETETKERTWLDKGATKDGVTVGNIAKSAYNTYLDIGENLWTGILGMGEKAVDAGAYGVGLAAATLGDDKFVDATKKFIAKDLYDEKAVARKVLPFVSGAGVGVPYAIANAKGIVNPDEYSFLGDKADGVVQSGGQLLGSLGLQAAGVPMPITTGVTSFGGEVESAFNDDATYLEAGVSGAITAFADIITEQLSSAIKPKGFDTLDEAVIDPLIRKISNKIARTAAKMGIDIVGEGAEEWLAEDISRFGQWLTYQDEKTLKEMLWSEEALNEKLEAFLGGAFLGGFGSAGKVVNSAVTGVDYTTGLTKAQEEAVNAEVDRRVAEAKANGEKVSRNKIYNELVKSLRPNQTQSNVQTKPAKAPKQTQSTPTQTTVATPTQTTATNNSQETAPVTEEALGANSDGVFLGGFGSAGKVVNSTAQSETVTPIGQTVSTETGNLRQRKLNDLVKRIDNGLTVDGVIEFVERTAKNAESSILEYNTDIAIEYATYKDTLSQIQNGATKSDILAKATEAKATVSKTFSKWVADLNTTSSSLNKLYSQYLYAGARSTALNDVANAMNTMSSEQVVSYIEGKIAEIKTKATAPVTVQSETVATEPVVSETQPTTAKETTPSTKGVTSAYTNDNQKIDMKYKVVSVEDLITSNNADGTVNPKYPQEYQPRERTRQASILQVQNIANNVIPEKLGESTNVSDGSPIIGSDNVVESGNGRTMALALMYKNNPEGAKKYVEFLKANADKFGIDANNLPKNPVLVRERITEVDRAEFVKKANESNLSAMSATELAKSDAERLTSDILNLLVANDDGNLNTAENKAFVGRVISEVFSKNDLNSVIGANGMLSANGLERIRNALFYKAYGDISLASRLAESLDNDIKNITNVLTNIAPKVVKVKNGIANGVLYDIDFSQDIVDGVNYLQSAKAKGKSVVDFDNQTTVFEETSNIAKAIAYVFEQKNRGAKQATLFFNHLCDIILSKNPNQLSFLGDTKAPTKEDVINEAVNRYNNDVESETNAIVIPERFIPQRSQESAGNDVIRGTGNNVESSSKQGSDDSQGNGIAGQQGYVETQTTVGGNESTPKSGDSGKSDSRPASIGNDTEVGAGEVKKTKQNNPVVVGDAFTDTKNGDTIKIIGRDDLVTTVEFTDKNGNKVTTEFDNKNADSLKNIPRYKQIESGESTYNKEAIDNTDTETPTQNAQNTPKSSKNESGDQIPTETKKVATTQNTSDTEVKESTNNGTQKPEVLGTESGNDDGGLQPESRNADGEKGTGRVSGDNRQASGEILPSDTVTGGRSKPDVGNDGKGTSRTTDNGVSGQEGNGTDGNRRGRGDSDGGRDSTHKRVAGDRVTGETTDTESSEEAPEVIETVDKAIEKNRPSNKENFTITNDVAEELDNNLPSAKDNIEAIELLLKIESEGRPATADEKRILAKYKGWGGIDIRRIDWELSKRLSELYDYDQRRSMQDSGLNAFFTPTKVIDAMYNGLKVMGFKGGNVLETSMGIGNFFGRMPKNILSKSALTGIELESYTARIAQMLYPGATVINKPFQDVVIKNGSYDLVIGNVPFGNEKLSYNGKKYSLHNYFIISSLDKVIDGGVVAVITSAGTLDNYDISARSAIMDRADVVGCYKLPAGVFSRNAKTDVQSDLLVLRKRASGAKPVGDSILNVTEKDGMRLNEYFVKHPENILGTLSKGTNAWGEITTVLNNGKFDEMLTEAMNKLPKNIMSGENELKSVDTIVTTESKPRFFEKDGKIYADNGAGEAVALTRNVDVARDYIAVRDAYKVMLDAYDQKLPEAEIKPLREALNTAYDNFYSKHSAISGDGKKKIGEIKCRDNTFLEADADYYLLCGLERYDKKAKKFEKSALFDKDTLRKKTITSVETSSEALAIALNETGGIDFKRMSELTSKTEKELTEELKGEIVYTPQGKYELIDIYLSGDIYAKLEEVKGKPEFKEQEEMLKKVLPTPKDASQITVKLGANYIDASYIEDFASEIFNERITVKKNSTGNWVIEGAERGRYGAIVNSKYGCDALNAVQLLQRILNDADIVCNKTVQQGDKKISIFDKEMTDIALGKAQDIRDAFEQWIFKDAHRRNDIADKYNRTYNAFRPLGYEHIASKLTFNDMNPTLRARLYPHQRKGIARFLFGGNTLFAHGVGTGKTFEMIASVMEAKSMGIVNKTAMVVPNNKVVDFKRDILEAYPTAKVLVIDTANKKRQAMLGLVNSNDWDIILIARTTFTKIPVSAEMQKNFYNSQLEALEREIAEAQGDRNVSKRQINGLITQRKNLEEKLKDLDKETDRDVGVDFDKLGIDCICVDEAHNYKSITTPSKLQIKGLVNKNDAQQANDMLMKLDYLRSIDGKIVFGTGTPITNTVSEIYNMIRMVRPDILENADIHSLDEWVNTFAKVESNFEQDIDGTIKTKPTKTIRNFVNSKEMVAMFRQFADIVFTQDVVKNLPKAIHHSIEIKGTKEHKLIKNAVNSALSSAKGTERLGKYGSASGMLNASAVDLRMLAGVDKEDNPLKDYTTEELDYEDSKINTMCGYILKHYKDSQDIKGTQIIFCDGGAGSGKTYTFNAHKDIKQKLIEQGIPEAEIVIVKDQSEAKLEELYAQVNSGEVRVLIGTSAKMAEGLNVQERVVAIHHPTVSYKPSDLEQSDARGVRSGNINSEVHIYRYLQGDTFDSHKWQAIDRKSEMIRNALKGEDVGELEDIGADEEGGADIDPATAMAITSGNPLVKAKIDIDKKVASLLNVKKNYQSNLYHYQDILAKYPTEISSYKTLIAKIQNDIALRNKYGDKTHIVIKGKTYDKPGEANKALVEAVKSTAKNGTYIKIGEYNGFDIMFKGETGGIDYSLKLKGTSEYLVEYNANGNTMARFDGVLKRLDKDVERYKAFVEQKSKDLETAKQEVNKPFVREKELEEALAEQKKITYDYEHYGEVKDKYETTNNDDNDDGDGGGSYDLASSNDRWKTDNVERNNKKKADVSLDSIVKKIRNKFGIPIATGKVPSRDARGVYKRKAEVIRTRIANNIPTIAHELGHHLDKLYSFSDMGSVEKLMKAIPQEFLSQYSADKQASEAIAEFVRTYLKSKTEAKQLNEDFYNNFVNTLSKEDLQAINDIADDFNYYLSMDNEAKYKSSISEGRTKLKRRKLSYFYTKVVAQFYPIKEVTDFIEETTGETLTGNKNPYKLAENSLGSKQIAKFLVENGFRNLQGDIINEKSLIECIEKVKAKDLMTFAEYLVLKHSVELHEYGVRSFGDDTLQDKDTMIDEITRIENKHPEMIQASENLYRFQRNMLKYYLVDSGLISQNLYDTLVEKYPCYVPFYRDLSNKLAQTGHGLGKFANIKAPIKRIKGSGAPIINPIKSIIENVEKFVKLSLENQAWDVLTSYADNVDGFGQFVEKTAPDMQPHTTDITAYKEKLTKRLQETLGADEFFSVTSLLDEIIGDTITDFTPKANASKGLVTVMRKGHPAYYQVHDAELYDAIGNTSPARLSGMIKLVGIMSRVPKTLFTTYSHTFGARNPIRDFRAYYVRAESNNPLEITSDYFKGLWGLITKDDDYKQWKAMGGDFGDKTSVEMDQLKQMLRDIKMKDKGKATRFFYGIVCHPLQSITKLTSFSESIPRLADFKAQRKSGKDLQDAIHSANDITNNWNRHGSSKSMQEIDKVIYFNNAAIQGLDSTIRHSTGKNWKGYWAKTVTFAVFMTALQRFFNKDEEEEYERLSTYTKNNFYNFSIGDGEFISIPKSREVSIPDSFIERVVDSAFGDKDAFYDFGGYLADNILPPMLSEHMFTLDAKNAIHDIAGSTIFGGFSDIGFNQNYLGNPIESNYEENYLESWERYDENTSKVAHWLGQTLWARKLGYSPKQIDHLLSNYLGSIGTTIQAHSPMDKTRADISAGLIKAFVKDSVYSTDILNKLWDISDEAEKEFKFDNSIDNAVIYESQSVIASYMSNMLSAINSLPIEERRDGRKFLIENIEKWENLLASSQEEMQMELAGMDIDSKVIVKLPESVLDWTETDKDGKKHYLVYQMTPEEYDHYVEKTLKMVNKYRTQCYQNFLDKEGNLDVDGYLYELPNAISEAKAEVKQGFKDLYKDKRVEKK